MLTGVPGPRGHRTVGRMEREWLAEREGREAVTELTRQGQGPSTHAPGSDPELWHQGDGMSPYPVSQWPRLSPSSRVTLGRGPSPRPHCRPLESSVVTRLADWRSWVRDPRTTTWLRLGPRAQRALSVHTLPGPPLSSPERPRSDWIGVSGAACMDCSCRESKTGANAAPGVWVPAARRWGSPSSCTLRDRPGKK